MIEKVFVCLLLLVKYEQMTFIVWNNQMKLTKSILRCVTKIKLCLKLINCRREEKRKEIRKTKNHIQTNI